MVAMGLDFVTVVFVWDEELKLYSAYIPDVPVCGEGATKQKALAHLEEGIKFYLEDVSREEFLSQIIAPMEHEKIKLSRFV